MAGLVAVPGGDPDLGQDVADYRGCLDATLRRAGGLPAYALTDHEKTAQSNTSSITRVSPVNIRRASTRES